MTTEYAPGFRLADGTVVVHDKLVTLDLEEASLWLTGDQPWQFIMERETGPWKMNQRQK